MRHYHLMWLFFILCFLAGCGAERIQITELEPIKLLESTSEIKGSIGIVLADFEINSASGEFGETTKRFLLSEVVDAVSDSGMQMIKLNEEELVQVEKAISLLENGENTDYRVLENVDLVIKGHVFNLNVSHKLLPAHVRKSVFTGEIKKRPEYCEITIIVEGDILAYGGLPFAKITNIPFSFHDKNKFYGDCKEFDDRKKIAQLESVLITRIQKQRLLQTSDIFALGHVEFARKDSKTDRVYYRLSLKPSRTLPPGSMVEFFEKRHSNLLVDDEVIVRGRVVCSSLEKLVTYVKVTEPKAQTKIKDGTLVKLDDLFSSLFVGQEMVIVPNLPRCVDNVQNKWVWKLLMWL